MTYTYEFELFPHQDAFVAIPFDLKGRIRGKSRAQAAAMAVDWLRGEIKRRIKSGTRMAKPTFGNMPAHNEGVVLLASVDVSCEDMGMEIVSAAKAAEMLKVSRPRISQMLKAGALDGYRKKQSTFVTRISVQARLDSPPKPGRPRKALER